MLGRTTKLLQQLQILPKCGLKDGGRTPLLVQTQVFRFWTVVTEAIGSTEMYVEMCCQSTLLGAVQRAAAKPGVPLIVLT
jgi:hypothetical protein